MSRVPPTNVHGEERVTNLRTSTWEAIDFPDRVFLGDC